MKKISQTESLNQTISLLENRRDAEWNTLLMKVNEIKEGLKPLKLLHTVIEKVIPTVAGAKGNLIKSAISVGAGYLSNKIVSGKSPGFFRKFLGSMLQLAVTNFVSKKADTK